MENFKVLYSFSSNELAVVEVKRLDRPEGSSPADVYKWLALFPKQGRVVPLTFKSMDRGAQEYRAFEEGEITFDERRASFRLFGQEHVLVREETEKLSEDKLIQLKRFIQNLGN